MAITKSGLLFDYKSAGNSTTSGAQALASTAAVDDYVIVSVEGNSATGSTVGVSDSKSHTWTALTQVINTATGGGWVQLFYTKVTSALVSGTDTITATRTGTGSLLAQARRVTGADLTTPIDVAQVSNTNGTGNTAVTTGSSMSVADGSLVFAAAMLSSTNSISSVGAGFTAESDGASTSTNIRSYGTIYQIKSGAGSVTPSFTAASSGLWAIAAVAFKAAATTTPVSTTRATTWGVRAQITTTRATTAAVRVAIATTRAAAAYAVRVQIVATRATSYNVGGTSTTITLTRATSWNTRSRSGPFDFEVGQIASWNSFGPFNSYTPATSYVASTEQAHGGTRSLKVTWPAEGVNPKSWVNIRDVNPLVDGKTYHVQAWAYVPTGNPDIRADVLFRSSSAYYSTKDAWFRIDHWYTHTAPTSEAYIGFGIDGTTAGKVAYFDDVSVSQGVIVTRSTSWRIGPLLTTTRSTSWNTASNIVAPTTVVSRAIKVYIGEPVYTGPLSYAIERVDEVGATDTADVVLTPGSMLTSSATNNVGVTDTVTPLLTVGTSQTRTATNPVNVTDSVVVEKVNTPTGTAARRSMGIYNHGPSGDAEIIRKMNATPDVSSSYIQNFEKVDIAGDTARLRRGTDVVMLKDCKKRDSETVSMQRLWDISNRNDANGAMTWLWEYIDAGNTLSLVDANRRVYQALVGEWDGKVQKGQYTGNDAQPDVYAEACSVFFEESAKRAPRVRTMLWVGGFQQARILSVYQALRKSPDVLTTDPYNNGTSVETMFQTCNAHISRYRSANGIYHAEWVRMAGIRARAGATTSPALGITENGIEIDNAAQGVGAAHTDAQGAAYYTDVRKNVIAPLDLELYVMFNSNADNPHTITDGTTPLSQAAFAKSLQAPKV